MRVEFHPLTTSDLNNAVAYYNRQQVGLGDELRIEVYASIERVLASPAQFSVVSKDVRRCLVHRFPSILFRFVSENNLRVLVIRHHRREPSFGLSRR